MSKIKVNDFVKYNPIKNKNSRPLQNIQEGKVYQVVKVNRTVKGQTRLTLVDENSKRVERTYTDTLFDIVNKEREIYLYNKEKYYIVFENKKVVVLENVQNGSIITALPSERIVKMPNLNERIEKLFKHIEQLSVPYQEKVLLKIQLESIIKDLEKNV